MPRLWPGRYVRPARAASRSELFRDIVLNGALASRGMEWFGDLLSEAAVDAIQAYLVDQNRQA
ncbi:MAG TPA: hypothetical protein VLZ74_10115 [Methylocella sp.]|nr:hypothetical protein [Methylocella sp.]